MSLTLKQEKFVIKYLECGNASEAYRFSYNCVMMKPTTINRKAKELMDNGKITARIKELQVEVAEKLLVSDDSVLKEYSRIGFSDIRKICHPDGSLKKTHEMDADTAAAIKSVKVDTKRDGDEILHIHEIKFWPKNQALESLSKHLGLFEKDNKQGGLDVVILHDASGENLVDGDG